MSEVPGAALAGARRPSSVRVRTMHVADLDAALVIEQASSVTPWSSSVFTDEVAHPQRRYLVATGPDGTVLGFCGLWLAVDEAHIVNIAVDPSQRRAGVASHLLEAAMTVALEHDLRPMTLEVRASNVAAQKLYFGFGFAPAGVRPKYYDAPDLPNGKEHALILTCDDVAGALSRRP